MPDCPVVITAIGATTEAALREAVCALPLPACVWGTIPERRAYVAMAAWEGGANALLLPASDYSDLYYDNAERLIALWYERQTKEATPNG